MTTEVFTPRDVRTTLNYYQPRDQPSYFYVACKPPAGVPAYNIGNEPHPAVIRNARGKQDVFKLDISGFQWVNYPSVEKEFVDEERIKTVYYAEVEDILKKHAGAKRVFIYNHTIRKSSKPETGPVRLTDRGPAHVVHVDQSPAAAEQKVRYHLPDDAERLLKGRYQIITVWRPIAYNVAHWPLGVVDFRSVDVRTDLISVRVFHAHRESGTYHVRYNPRHKWYYLSDQTPDEVTLLKAFDSDGAKSGLTPHSAFPDTTSPAGAPQRRSIEVRALVFDRE